MGVLFIPVRNTTQYWTFLERLRLLSETYVQTQLRYGCDKYDSIWCNSLQIIWLAFLLFVFLYEYATEGLLLLHLSPKVGEQYVHLPKPSALEPTFWSKNMDICPGCHCHLTNGFAVPSIRTSVCAVTNGHSSLWWLKSAMCTFILLLQDFVICHPSKPRHSLGLEPAPHLKCISGSLIRT